MALKEDANFAGTMTRQAGGPCPTKLSAMRRPWRCVELSWTLAIFGLAAPRSGMDPEGWLGGKVVERRGERQGDDAERA